MPSNDLTLCRPLFLLPSIFPSIRVFSNESALCIRWPKYWSFSFSISLSNEYSGLISLRIDWFDLLAVQRTLKRILQHHGSKASILRYFFWKRCKKCCGGAWHFINEAQDHSTTLVLSREEKIPSLWHCWWECKLMRPLRFLRKIKIELPYDSAIPLPDI